MSNPDEGNPNLTEAVEPATIPPKTQEQLVKLSDQLMDFMLIVGVQVNTTEYFLLKSAYHGYPELAKIAILAGANILATHQEKTALQLAEDQHHAEIATLITNVILPTATGITEYPIPCQEELNDRLLKFHQQTTAAHTLTPVELYPLIRILTSISIWHIKNDQAKLDSIPQIRQDIAYQITQFEGVVAREFFPYVLKENSYALWQIYIQAGLPINNADNVFKCSPLHVAVAKNQYCIASLLVQSGADVNSQEAPFEDTPLMHAVRTGNAQMLTLLLAHGAKPQLQNQEGKSAESLDPLGGYVARLTGTHPYIKPDQRATLKSNAIHDYSIHAPIRATLQTLRKKRDQNIEAWKTWRNTPDGRVSMQRLYHDLLDILDNSLPVLGNELFKFAKMYDYTELRDVCNFVGFGNESSPVLFSQTVPENIETQSSEIKPQSPT